MLKLSFGWIRPGCGESYYIWVAKSSEFSGCLFHTRGIMQMQHPLSFVPPSHVEIMLHAFRFRGTTVSCHYVTVEFPEKSEGTDRIGPGPEKQEDGEALARKASSIGVRNHCSVLEDRFIAFITNASDVNGSLITLIVIGLTDIY
jgi:hypothetical protein